MNEATQEGQSPLPKRWIGENDIPIVKVTDLTATVDGEGEITLFLGQVSPPLIPESTPEGKHFEAEEIDILTVGRFAVQVDFLLAAGSVGEYIRTMLDERRKATDVEG